VTQFSSPSSSISDFKFAPGVVDHMYCHFYVRDC
jgi:hypothetical protein